MVHTIFLKIVSLFCFVHSKFNAAEGVTFHDLFNSHESEIWDIEQGHLHCGSASCILAQPENVRYVTTQVAEKRGHLQKEIQLWLKNDCRDKSKCCMKHGKVCTEFTGGEFISLLTYPYGKFFFLGRAASPNQGFIEAWSCFVLMRFIHNHDRLVKMSIDICFPTQDNTVIRFGVSYGDDHHMINLRVDFDTTTNTAMYRVDWEPDRISLYIGGVFAHSVTSKDVTIPDDGLHIKTLLLPQDPNNGYMATSPEGTHEMFLSIHQIAFQKAESVPDHTELFIQPRNDESFISWNTALFFALASAFIVLIVGFCRKEIKSLRPLSMVYREEIVPNGYKSLLDDDIENLS